MINKFQSSLSSQKGIATILTVMLVGIVLSVTILGTAYYIRAKQHAEVANHAVTNAQSGAWIGVELLRKYFESLNKNQIDSLQIGNAAIGLSGITASIDSITPPTNSTDPYQIIATIKNVSATSQAASSIRVLYNIVPSTSSSGGSGGGTGTTSAMDIYSDLDLSGGITFSQNGTSGASINVYGDFSTGGVGLKGIDTLSTTGNVNLDSQAQINNIYSNGNVTLKGGSSAQLISAKGWIDIKSGGTQGDLYADKYITISNGSLNSATTLSYIDVSGGGTSAKTLTAGSYVNVSGGGSTVDKIQSKGNVNLTTWGKISNVISEQKLTCVSTDWFNFSLLKAASFVSCPTGSNVQAGSNSVIATGALLTVTAPSKPLVNALSYESQANYILDVDNQKNITVTVKNVDGIATGTYYIAKYTESNNDYIGQLCSKINKQGFCDSTPVGYIYPKNVRANVIAYSGGTWSLNINGNSGNPSMAPGVFLFKGDLKPQQGTYANTFLSTGNIDYGTSITLQAPNYAGATLVCNSAALGYSRPTNLCSSSTALIPAAIGNIALLAGSCTNATTVALCQSTYSGGDISLGAQSTVYGNVIAGNLLNTSGQSLIVGSLSAAGLGDTKKGSKFSGGTTIDLTSLKDHPDFSTGGNGSNSGSTSTGSGTTTATVKWARYL